MLAVWLNRHHRRLRYAICAVLLFVGITAAPQFIAQRLQQLSVQTLDWMIRNRAFPPRPDPDIVVLDIDEKSLARLAPLAGRWPWPRTVLGEVLEELERQGAAAVVFDILFSDPDVLNPSADEAFANAIARSRIAWFPILRLDTAADAASRLRAADVPGLVRSPGANPEARIGLTLPLFRAAVDSGRLGTHNAVLDPDGRIRRLRLWDAKEGWQVPSLPAALARAFGWALPADPEVRINFMEDVQAHRRVSFADLWEDLQRKARTRAADEFRGKIVIVGATAPSLFDVKASPLAAAHPGVHLLATAIDNLKNRALLYDLPEFARRASVVVFLAAAMLAVASGVPEGVINRWNAYLQPIFLLVAWVSLQIGPWIVDLTQILGLGITLLAWSQLVTSLEQRLERTGGPLRSPGALATGAWWLAVNLAKDEEQARAWRAGVLAVPGTRVLRNLLVYAFPGGNAAPRLQVGLSRAPIAGGSDVLVSRMELPPPGPDQDRLVREEICRLLALLATSNPAAGASALTGSSQGM